MSKIKTALNEPSNLREAIQRIGWPSQLVTEPYYMKDRTVLMEATNYEEIHQSSMFQNFKYIKILTPMRRFIPSHGATVRFMYAMAQAVDDREKGKTKTVASNAIMGRMLNRSFMIAPQDRLYKDSVLVRFEDGKSVA